jgi:pSer/pThr/pTyr-binding forkhead associated (FHA) protein
VLEDPYASEFHMRLVRQDGGIVLHDLGSTNGTYVNGRRVGSPISLSQGDAIQVGKTIMEVR